MFPSTILKNVEPELTFTSYKYLPSDKLEVTVEPIDRVTFPSVVTQK